MNEISILLKDLKLMTGVEYKALDRYASHGRAWIVINKYEDTVYRYRSREYIFEEENLILFKLVSPNIFAQWYTENTRRLKYGEEYQLHKNLFIRLNTHGF